MITELGKRWSRGAGVVNWNWKQQIQFSAKQKFWKLHESFFFISHVSIPSLNRYDMHFRVKSTLKKFPAIWRDLQKLSCIKIYDKLSNIPLTGGSSKFIGPPPRIGRQTKNWGRIFRQEPEREQVWKRPILNITNYVLAEGSAKQRTCVPQERLDLV